MTVKNLRNVATVMMAIALVSACAAESEKRVSSDELQKLVRNAQVTFRNFVRDADQTWVHDNIGRAKAVLIAPQIVKAGFILGGCGGRAVLEANGRSVAHPALENLTGPA